MDSGIHATLTTWGIWVYRAGLTTSFGGAVVLLTSARWSDAELEGFASGIYPPPGSDAPIPQQVMGLTSLLKRMRRQARVAATLLGVGFLLQFVASLSG